MILINTPKFFAQRFNINTLDPSFRTYSVNLDIKNITVVISYIIPY